MSSILSEIIEYYLGVWWKMMHTGKPARVPTYDRLYSFNVQAYANKTR